MRLVIDTNIFVSSLDPTDIHHSECVPILKRLARSEMEALCPDIVLLETVCVLRRRLTSEDTARKALQFLAFMPAISWLETSFDAVCKACRLGIATGLKGADALVVQTASEYGISLLTKDYEMHRRAPESVSMLWPT